MGVYNGGCGHKMDGPVQIDVILGGGGGGGGGGEESMVVVEGFK